MVAMIVKAVKVMRQSLSNTWSGDLEDEDEDVQCLGGDLEDDGQDDEDEDEDVQHLGEDLEDDKSGQDDEDEDGDDVGDYYV